MPHSIIRESTAVPYSINLSSPSFISEHSSAGRASEHFASTILRLYLNFQPTLSDQPQPGLLPPLSLTVDSKGQQIGLSRDIINHIQVEESYFRKYLSKYSGLSKRGFYLANEGSSTGNCGQGSAAKSGTVRETN